MTEIEKYVEFVYEVLYFDFFQFTSPSILNVVGIFIFKENTSLD